MSDIKKYDSTVARIAGNLLSGVLSISELHTIGQDIRPGPVNYELVAAGAVRVARAIVAETKRQTESTQ